MGDIEASIVQGYRNFLLTKGIGHMFSRISKLASYCPKGRVHHFVGYPRESGRCRWCGVRRTQ